MPTTHMTIHVSLLQEKGLFRGRAGAEAGQTPPIMNSVSTGSHRTEAGHRGS